MLPELQELAKFYVYSNARFWSCLLNSSGKYYDIILYDKTKKIHAVCETDILPGDVLIDYTNSIMTYDGKFEIMYSNYERLMEVWNYHPITKLFVYSSYWLDYKWHYYNKNKPGYVWLDHSKYGKELIKNITVNALESNKDVVALYSYVTINDMKFYVIDASIYVVDEPDDLNRFQGYLKEIFVKSGAFYRSSLSSELMFDEPLYPVKLIRNKLYDNVLFVDHGVL